MWPSIYFDAVPICFRTEWNSKYPPSGRRVFCFPVPRWREGEGGGIGEPRLATRPISGLISGPLQIDVRGSSMAPAWLEHGSRLAPVGQRALQRRRREHELRGSGHLLRSFSCCSCCCFTIEPPSPPSSYPETRRLLASLRWGAPPAARRRSPDRPLRWKT